MARVGPKPTPCWPSTPGITLTIIRNGVESHLGETADARITIDGLMVNGDMVTVSTETRFTIVSDGEKVFRPGFWVLTFRDGKIAQRVDVTPLPLKPAT